MNAIKKIKQNNWAENGGRLSLWWLGKASLRRKLLNTDLNNNINRYDSSS